MVQIWLTADGDEQKTFHVRDGQGIVLLHKAGVRTGIISGRVSAATERRARELGMAFLRQGITDKVAAFDEVLEVHTRVSKIGNTSLIFDFEIYPEAGERLIGTAQSLYVCVDPKTLQKMRVPDDLRLRLSEFEGKDFR